MAVDYYIINTAEPTVRLVDFDSRQWWSALHHLGGHLSIKLYQDENAQIESYLYYDLTGTQIAERPDSVKVNHKVAHSVMYPQGHDYFAIAAEFVQKHDAEAAPTLGIEYLEAEDYVILSYYTGNKSISQWLLITDKNGNKLLSTIIDTNVQGLGHHSFLVIDQRLIFVKEKVELIIYDL